MSAATEPSWRLRPGGEMTDVLDGLHLLGADLGPARDALAYIAGRDPKTFALAVAYAAPDLLPERIRAAALDALPDPITSVRAS